MYQLHIYAFVHVFFVFKLRNYIYVCIYIMYTYIQLYMQLRTCTYIIIMAFNHVDIPMM